MRFGALTYAGLLYPYAVERGERRVLRRHSGHDVGALVGMSSDQLSAEVSTGEPFAWEAAVIEPPIRPAKVVAIGLNYMDHVREAHQEVPKVPIVFAKFPSSITADGRTVTVDRTLTERVDWEVELAVVIGTTARNVSSEHALRHVFGYTVANDLSARDIQFSDGQWTRGKSLDGFCPLGPEIVTADEIPDPQSLRLSTRVNGETVQDASTSQMVFTVAELIAFCSRSFTLEPGDLILTGTPWGCGEFMTPRRSLADGDVVTVSATSIGAVTNPIEIRGH